MTLTEKESELLVQRDINGLCWKCGSEGRVPHSNYCTTCYNPGFVYVLRTEDGYVKIGKAKHLERRIKQLSIQLPFPVSVVCVLWSDDRTGLERELHVHFAHKRVNGEWFVLEEEDRKYLRLLSLFHGLAAPPAVHTEAENLRTMVTTASEH